jgi:hypothetical protein
MIPTNSHCEPKLFSSDWPVRGLKDQKMLLPSQTISLWLLNNYLKKNNLSINDINIIDQDEKLGPLPFNEFSQFSAVVGWNPLINDALIIPPKSLLNTDAESIFRPREVDIESLIYFRES